ncbi:hypothetical protein [Carnobacterium funditum]|nr:hypothetical protein [Carnobacterium funditum]
MRATELAKYIMYHFDELYQSLEDDEKNRLINFVKKSNVATKPIKKQLN